MLSGFSRERDYLRCHLARGSVYCPGSASPPDLPGRNIPTRFNALFRQCAGVSLLRLHIALIPSNGMLTVSSIGCALRLCLRSRLTLIRLALIRNPWSYGGEFLAPLVVTYTYICFSGTSRKARAFPSTATGMLPYQSCSKHDSTSSAPDLCPIIIHAGPLD